MDMQDWEEEAWAGRLKGEGFSGKGGLLERVLPWERNKIPEFQGSSSHELTAYLAMLKPYLHRGRWWHRATAPLRGMQWMAIQLRSHPLLFLFGVGPLVCLLLLATHFAMGAFLPPLLVQGAAAWVVLSIVLALLGAVS